MPIAYGIGGTISVPQGAIEGVGAPPASFKGELGQIYVDTSTRNIYIYDGANWDQNELTLDTDGTFASASNSTASSSLAIKTYVDATAVAGAPIASDSTNGIGKTVTDANALARIANSATEAYFVSPENLDAILASPSAIGGTAAAAGTFTDLTADGTGAVSLGSNAAADFTVAAGDLTLAQTTGSLVVNAGEAAADAIDLNAASGGFDVDVALLASITSTRNNAQAILLESTAGGIDILASGSGGAGEDIDIICTGGSVNISGTENAADAVTIAAANGGIDITCGGAAGEDIDIVNTAGSIVINAGEAAADAINMDSAGGIDVDAVGQVNIASSQNAADALRLNASAGGIDIDAAGAAGEDINIANAAGSVVLVAGEAIADSIVLSSTAGGIDILAPGASAGLDIDITNTGGSVNITATEAAADAIVLSATTALGGIDVNAGTGGMTIDSAGLLSLDSAGATNLTATGAFDVTVSSTAGSVILNAEEAAADALRLLSAAGGLDANVALQMNLDSSQVAADAVRVIASDAAGGIDIDAGTGGIAIDSTGALSLDGAAASNFSVSGAGIDLSLISSGGRVVVNGEEAAADAVRLLSAAGGIDADAALQINVASSQNAADAIRLNASAGGIDIDAAGAAGEDITIDNAAGSIKLTSGEAIADSMVLTSAGGLDLAVTGGAGIDIDVTCTSGSMNVTVGENASDALVVNCSGAASGISVDCGTAGVTVGTGLNLAVTSVATAATPYALLGTDYFVTTDSTGGALEITLPAAPATGRTVIVYDGAGQAAAGGNVTINGNGKNIAAGGTSAATKVLNTAYESYTLTYNGTLWCGQNIV